MGLNVQLQREDGRALARLDDPTQILHRFLPFPEDASYPLLRYVDWYQDTIFNQLQCAALIPELQRIAHKAGSEEESRLVKDLIELARRCSQEEHHYLRFIGD